MRFFLLIILSFIFVQCTVKNSAAVISTADFQPDTLTYFDQSRNRRIPIAIYHPKDKKTPRLTPVIFSHGWGENKGSDYFVYSYLTMLLASKGYFVVSIQHELPTDEMLAMDGNFQVTRMPNWKRGADNILFVLNTMKKDFPELNYDRLTVIGHSNGGDMTALFASQHPELIHKVITMDNRRMPLPRTARPKIYTLRSNDYPADEGVLPTGDEKKKYGITVDFTPVNHGNMDNDASPEEAEYMNRKILDYLKN